MALDDATLGLLLLLLSDNEIRVFCNTPDGDDTIVPRGLLDSACVVVAGDEVALEVASLVVAVTVLDLRTSASGPPSDEATQGAGFCQLEREILVPVCVFPLGPNPC